jgi:hypothetical protein
MFPASLYQVPWVRQVPHFYHAAEVQRTFERQAPQQQTALSLFHGAGVASDRRPLHKTALLQTQRYDHCFYIATSVCTMRNFGDADPVENESKAA